MELEKFFEELDEAPLSLVIVNRTAPRPFQRMLENAFDDQPVAVEEETMPGEDEDTVALVADREDGKEVVATSPLEELNETILMVNSDLYKSGAVGLAEFELPDVLAEMHDTPFQLRGYPESNTEKLLLIVISRYVERRAWQVGRGTLRTSFQRLSRIRDERGTRTVYETVANTGVRTHVYGVPDWQPPAEFDAVTHGGYTEEFQKSWFVVYTPPEGDDCPDIGLEDPHLALLALETAPRQWQGFWTFRPELVEDIDRYIAHNL
jgi:hypothetical protein